MSCCSFRVVKMDQNEYLRGVYRAAFKIVEEWGPGDMHYIRSRGWRLEDPVSFKPGVADKLLIKRAIEGEARTTPERHWVARNFEVDAIYLLFQNFFPDYDPYTEAELQRELKEDYI